MHSFQISEVYIIVKIALKQIGPGSFSEGESLTWKQSQNKWISQGWYQYEESIPLVTTNSTSFQTGVSLTLDSGAPSGQYRYNWSFVYGASRRSGDVQFQIVVNGTVIHLYDIEATETYAFNHHPTYHGSKIITLNSGAGDNVRINYRTQSTGRTCYFRDAFVSLRYMGE